MTNTRTQHDYDQSTIRQLRESVAVEGQANEDLREQVDTLTRQRDDLLDALKELVRAIEREGLAGIAIGRAITAIASVSAKGGAA